MENLNPQVNDPETDRLLHWIAMHPSVELEWLDLLSQLEYVGCRKIVKTVAFNEISSETLRHISEEASHAYLLKALVEKEGLSRRSWSDGLLADIGWNYFQKLDHTVSTLQENASLNYPAVSWAVENRVLDIYPKYLIATRKESIKRVLRRILAQERRHGTQFNEVAFPQWMRKKIVEVEKLLWENFKRDFQKKVFKSHDKAPVIH